MSEEIKIEKGIPIPERAGIHGRNKYNFKIMEVGDSFFLPKVEGVDFRTLTNRVTISATGFRVRNPGWKFFIVRFPDGVRLWRTA